MSSKNYYFVLELSVLILLFISDMDKTERAWSPLLGDCLELFFTSHHLMKLARFCFVFFLIIIWIYLKHNVILVSSVQQSDSTTLYIMLHSPQV